MVNRHPWSPLRLACERGNVIAVCMLLRYGADPEEMNTATSYPVQHIFRYIGSQEEYDARQRGDFLGNLRTIYFLLVPLMRWSNPAATQSLRAVVLTSPMLIDHPELMVQQLSGGGSLQCLLLNHFQQSYTWEAIEVYIDLATR